MGRSHLETSCGLRRKTERCSEGEGALMGEMGPSLQARCQWEGGTQEKGNRS